MKRNVARIRRMTALLAVGCIGLLLPLLSAREPDAILEGHTGAVFSVVFSPDGKTIASGSGAENKPGEIKLWDVKTGKTQVSLKGHSDAVSSVAFSPDGKNLASGSADKTIKLWDVNTHKEQATFKGNRIVAFSPDGKTLASGSTDQTIKLWDVKTGKEQATLAGDTNSLVLTVAFSPDGKTIASGSGSVTPGFGGDGEGKIRLWDVKTGKEQATLLAHKVWVVSVAYSPDGKMLASAWGDKTIKLWKVKTVKNADK